jgi:hypothetical protein
MRSSVVIELAGPAAMSVCRCSRNPSGHRCCCGGGVFLAGLTSWSRLDDLVCSGTLHGRAKLLALDAEPFVISVGEAAQLDSTVTGV